MIGWINISVESFVREKFGDAVWDQTLQASGVQAGWVSSCPYPDAATYSLVITASNILGVTPAQALEAYGAYFVDYTSRLGYEKLLKSLGSNMAEFLKNLNDLHLHLSMSFPAMAAPAFKCTDVGPSCLTLHYHSHRPALRPIVVGVLKGLAEQYWGLVSGQLQVELLRGRDDGSDDHEVFRLSYPHQAALEHVGPPAPGAGDQDASAAASCSTATPASALPAAARSFTLSPERFYQLFPFHLLLDRSCRVVQAGSVLERLFPELRGWSGVPLGDVFQLKHPHVSDDFESLKGELDNIFVLKARANGMELKGQVVAVQLPLHPAAAAAGCPATQQGLLFMGTVRLSGLDDMQQHGIYISDIPHHDVNRDYVLLAEQRQAEAQLKERLESLTLQLNEANSRLGEATGWLDEERRRSDGLLYQMLPPEVASCLKHGERAPAREHPEATVLFSDIVGFTEIASRSSPLEVCSLLDELYQRFDAAIEEYPQLYKVETIGDAYMVVCNVTVPCDDHADVLLEFALRMHEEASLVASSLGEPVRIRVGMHSGPVVAGVVGRKMPRFCMFGDTVNTASRMESHGEAGKIHISEACYSCLRAKERFLIRERGNITVKGKGTMRTYFISPAAPELGSPVFGRPSAATSSYCGCLTMPDYASDDSHQLYSSHTSYTPFTTANMDLGSPAVSVRGLNRQSRASSQPCNPLVTLAGTSKSHLLPAAPGGMNGSLDAARRLSSSRRSTLDLGVTGINGSACSSGGDGHGGAESADMGGGRALDCNRTGEPPSASSPLSRAQALVEQAAVTVVQQLTGHAKGTRQYGTPIEEC